MAVADFYRRGNKNFQLAYFHHGTPQADEMQTFLTQYAQEVKLILNVGNISRERNRDESPEEYWRNERYAWLRSFGKRIVTAHHLGDACEGYLFSALHGNPQVMPVENQGVIRPFLINTKEQLREWCVKHEVPWVEDRSNQDTRYPRNKIRHEILPQVLTINPGFATVIRKKYMGK